MQPLEFAQDGAHLEDGVVAPLRRGAVGADAPHGHFDLHAAPLAAVNPAGGGLGGDHELGPNATLLHEVLPAEAIAVLLLHGAGDQEGVIGREIEILDDLAGVNQGGHAALLVAGPPAADDLLVLEALEGVELPVFWVADTHVVDMGIHGDQAPSAANRAQDVSHGIYFHSVEAHCLHLLLDAPDDLLFPAAFAGQGDQVP